jgi:acetyl-CoA carboxylase carboxyl transferase subunit beta
MLNKKESEYSISLSNWFEKQQKKHVPRASSEKLALSDGLWSKCKICDHLAYTKELQSNCMVCLECGHHSLVSSNDRIHQLIDINTWNPIDEGIFPTDPLEFHDCQAYSDRLKDYQTKTGLSDAVQTGLGRIHGLPIALGVMDFKFMGGSMGSVVGEKLTRLIELATSKQLPVIVVCASGGARMQEGMLSLMQMAKISGALELHRSAGLIYIPVLTHPTMGGVTASFAMLGDLVLAEPRALIGFAGRRVIEQTIREKLPDDFQTAEDLLRHGFVDAIIPRTKLKATLSQLVSFHQPVFGRSSLRTERIVKVSKERGKNIQQAS